MRARPVLLALVLATSTTVPVAVGVGGAPVAAASVPAGFTDSLVASVPSPTAVESLPDGRLVVLDQAGRVLAGRPGDALGEVLRLPTTCSGGERGLLGFTHDPGFLTNRQVYVFYTRDEPSAPGDCVNRVSRFTMTSTIDPASETVLLDGISSVNGNHNAGDLEVGSDGNLYVATGDAGRDPRGDSGRAGANDAAQDRSLLNGKILRITLDGRPAGGNPLVVPGSEPCATRGNTPTTPTSFCQEIYAWGLRNPYRFAWDPNRGDDRFFINDVGQSSREEVDESGIGRNYGWNVCEGPCPAGVAAANGFTDPVTSYPRTVGTYITAGAFVPDGLWPADLDGAYLFADGGTGSIFLRRADGSVDYDAPWATGVVGLADMVFAFDEAGRLALYYTLNGSDQVRKITWDGAGPSATPTDLAFAAVAPTRAYDTRNGIGVVAGDVRAGTTRLVDLDPPSPGVRAALVNLTVSNNAGWGFLQAWSPRSLRPATSVINTVRPGEDVANTAVVALDDEGRFVVQATMGTDVIVDVLGWFSETGGAVRGGRFVAVEPGRLVDTRRPAGTSLDSGSSNSYTEGDGRVDVPVADRLEVPASGDVAAVAVIVTALGAPGPAPGFVTAHPGRTAAPDASNVNTSGGGDIRANLALVPLGSDGSVSLVLDDVDDVLVDVVGWFTSSTAAPGTSGLFSAVPPVRRYDERQPGSPPAPAQGTLVLDVADGVPAASDAVAVVQNLTMTATTGFDFVTATPAGSPPREVSNVNATGADQTRAALSITPLGPGAQVGYTTFGESQLIVDVVGVFSR